MPAAVRLGLIGAGRWGRNVIRTVAGIDGIALAAVASRNPDSATLLPPDCRHFTDWREMLTAGVLDGVVIATPPACHAEMALAAIAAGIPVLVEKPLALDVAEAEAMARAAAAAAVPVMVDHIHLYNPAFRRFVALAPELGAIRAVYARAGNRGPYRADASVLWDWGPHDVAMLMRLFGRAPDAVDARSVERAVVDGHAAEIVDLALRFGDVLATVRIGTLMDRCRRFVVEGDNGVLTYDDLAAAKLTWRRPGQAVAEPVPCADEAPLARLLRDFAAVVAGAARVDDGLELGLAVVRVLADAQRRMERP